MRALLSRVLDWWRSRRVRHTPPPNRLNRRARRKLDQYANRNMRHIAKREATRLMVDAKRKRP